MKYFIYFVVCYLSGLAYVTATSLQGYTAPPVDKCPCKNVLEDVLKGANQLSVKVVQLNQTVTSVDVIILNITYIVEDQANELCEIDTILDGMIDIEKNNTNIINNQTVVLDEIYEDLVEICKNIEIIEYLLAQVACLLATLQRVAELGLKQCLGPCHQRVGAKA